MPLSEDEQRILNEIESNLRKVSRAQIQSIAKEYLRSTNRTILTIEAGSSAPNAQ